MWDGLGDPIDYPGAGSLNDWADLVAAGIRQRDVVCGLSMGGYAALALVRRHPAKLAGLVLADTRAEADTPAQKRGRDGAAELVRTVGVGALFESLVASLFRPDPDSAAVQRARGIALRQPPERVVAMLRALRDRDDQTGLLGSIAVPVTVICGAHDALTPPPLMRRLAEEIPGARYVEIADAGHLSALERPQAFAAARRPRS